MRIFKHRGDIYISSSKSRLNLEQKILFVILAAIVVFTVVFILLVGIKNDFSVKTFFSPGSTDENVTETAEILPEVSGKTNFLFILSNSDENSIYFCTVIQTDLDNLAYKVCTLSPGTTSGEKTLQSNYKTGGAAGVQSALGELLGISIDYYIDQTVSQYKTFFNSLGNVNYMIERDIKYKDTSTYGFSLKLSAGEQSIDGDTMSKLLRYYIAEESNYSAVNDIILTSLSQQMNSQNYEDKEDLFSDFIENSQTNITIKNFTSALDALQVISSDTVGMTVYNVTAEYDGASLTQGSISSIKGYFQ
ncbi:MAG: LCP family protein [Clostridiales bacterium]|nr:LCP family protein [Clostridiales bacterium]